MTGPGDVLGALMLRPFLPTDPILLEGGLPEGATVGLSAVLDDEVVAYGGLYRTVGRDWGFFHIGKTDGGERLRAGAPRMLYRLAREALARFDAMGVREIVAMCDPHVARSQCFLEALGFVPMAEADKCDDIRAAEAEHDSKTWVRRV